MPQPIGTIISDAKYALVDNALSGYCLEQQLDTITTGVFVRQILVPAIDQYSSEWITFLTRQTAMRRHNVISAVLALPETGFASLASGLGIPYP